MSTLYIEFCQRCGRPDYLWESTGCDVCAATVKDFELVGQPFIVSQGWQGSPHRTGDATCLKGLFALKARELRQMVGRWVSREEVIEALRPTLPDIANTSHRARMALGEIAAGRRLADYYKALMNAG